MSRQSSYFYWPIRFLAWVGVVVYELENDWHRALHKLYSYCVLVVFGYGYMVTEVIHIVEHFDELEEVTFTLCYLIAHFIAIGKIVVLTWKRREVAAFLANLESGVFLPDVRRGGSEEFAIINSAVTRTYLQAKIFATAVLAMLCSRIIPCLLNPTRKIYDPATNTTTTTTIYPYPSTLPFVNAAVSPYYELAFAYQVVSIALFGWYLGNSDTIITGLMIHVRAQFQIVVNEILTVSERASWNRNGLKGLVRNCVWHHSEIIDLVQDMEVTFNVLMLIQFLGSLLSLCVGLYQSSLLPFTDPTSISMMCYSLAIVFELLIYCWNGNEVSVYSTEVAKAAYNCQWLEADRDVKMSLLLVMLRAQRTCYLTAGKFSKISVETFVAIVKGSVSYFMVLRQMNEELEMS